MRNQARPRTKRHPHGQPCAAWPTAPSATARSKRALILSPIGGPDESAAFAAVTPMVSACMPADATVNFSKISLRGYVGEALYRLSMAARGASAPPS
ncbi:hypothetical protein VH570_08820 [Sphingobium sp. HT1-2]